MTWHARSVVLVNDLHHMTFLTADLDRLIAFYERIFDAPRNARS
jgi:catechol 2,3-dioxygenase-like lactoylglutathione lyase family enzyme